VESSIIVVREYVVDMMIVEAHLLHLCFDPIRKLKHNICFVALMNGHAHLYIKDFIKKGINKMVSKTLCKTDLPLAMNACLLNESFFSEPITKIIVEHSLKTNIKKRAYSGDLTRREKQILKYISEGYSTSKIATQLILSVNTIETHRRRIMHKLEVKNIAELITKAINEGMI
jgi:DNA-binding NarL/FixJ family response regulator